MGTLEHDTGIKKSDARVGRRIRYAYRAALSIIAAISLTFFFIERRSLQQFDAIASIINTSGQQRMLSQRSALYAEMLADSENQAASTEIIAELWYLREKIADNHTYIMDMGVRYGADDDSLSDGALKVYYGGKHNLNERLRVFLIDLDRILVANPEDRAEPAAKIREAAIGPLLMALEAAVGQFETDAKESVMATTQLQILMLIAVFMVLFAELMLIFRPLVRRIESGTRDLLEARDAMRHAALHDALTGLPNRRMLETIMENTAAVAKRRGETMVVCHIDLDFFKEINDTKGHATGDAVLCHAAQILRQSVRESDFIARVGGDESPNTHQARATLNRCYTMLTSRFTARKS